MRFADDSPSWCYLPQEILHRILHFVDDWDIRIHFGFTERLESHRYDAVRSIVRMDAYYKWSCGDLCGPHCNVHRHGVDFNPILHPVVSNPPSTFLYIPPHHLGRLDSKFMQPWQKFTFTVPLPKLVNGGSLHKPRSRINDMLEVTIVQYADSVSYEMGVWRVRRKTGEKPEMEEKNMYYLDGLSRELYYTDFLMWCYDVV